MTSPSDGGIADQVNPATDTVTIQELASAGPSAIDSFGPERGCPLVRVEIAHHSSPTLSFLLRCGLVAAGGES